ncbi:MAG: DUF2505 family protein [Microthrixaceae bacterium]
MRFGFEQRWSASVGDVVDLYTDESFWNGVSGFGRTSAPEVLEVTRDGSTARTRLRWRLAVDLPREASRFIDPDDVAWVEDTRWDLHSASARVAFEPVQAATLLRASADVVVVTDGDEAVRRVTGELKVRIPLLGHRVESAITDEDRRAPLRGGRGRGGSPRGLIPEGLPCSRAPAVVHEVREPLEEVAAVVGTGAGLGVVLDREGGDIGAPEPSSVPSLRLTWVTSAASRVSASTQ